MDRICLSVAMLPISKELGWGESVQGLVQSAFLWGYLANQLLGGTMADVYGGKKVMAWGITFFSLASMLLPSIAITPWTASLGLTLPAVAFSRFLVGFGEGVALPSMNNLIATRIQPARRATALGSAFMGFHAGNLVGLVLSPIILQKYGWRALFYVFGAVGLPLVLLWQLTVPPPPPPPSIQQQQDTINTNNTNNITTRVSFSSMLQNKHVWAIIIANIVNHWGYFMYLNWMPTYFVKVLGMDLRASSFMSFVPWLVMATGSSLSGILSDTLVSTGMNTTTVRKAIQTVAFLGPIIPLIALASGGLTPLYAVVAMTAALGITSIGQFVANMSDIAPKHAGRLFGLCNTFGSMSGIMSVSLAGVLVEKTGSFSMVFLMTAVLNVIGVMVWNLLCTAEKQFD